MGNHVPVQVHVPGAFGVGAGAGVARLAGGAGAVPLHPAAAEFTPEQRVGGGEVRPTDEQVEVGRVAAEGVGVEVMGEDKALQGDHREVGGGEGGEEFAPGREARHLLVVEELLPGHDPGAGLEGGGGPERRAARLPVVKRQGGHLGLEDVAEEGGGIEASPVRGPGHIPAEVDGEEIAEEFEFGGDGMRH